MMKRLSDIYQFGFETSMHILESGTQFLSIEAFLYLLYQPVLDENSLHPNLENQENHCLQDWQQLSLHFQTTKLIQVVLNHSNILFYENKYIYS